MKHIRTRQPRMLSQAQALSYLRDHAEAGERCPTNADMAAELPRMDWSLQPHTLAKLGLLRVEVYGRNWRVVEIDGVRTAPPPHGGKPHKVIG